MTRTGINNSGGSGSGSGGCGSAMVAGITYEHPTSVEGAAAGEIAGAAASFSIAGTVTHAAAAGANAGASVDNVSVGGANTQGSRGRDVRDWGQGGVPLGAGREIVWVGGDKGRW